MSKALFSHAYGRNIMTYRRKLTSYAAHARFLSECADEPRGEVHREVMNAANIRTPYASSPAVTVYDWQGTPVLIAETSHRVYEVWTVDPVIVLDFGSTDAAFDAEMAGQRRIEAVADAHDAAER